MSATKVLARADHLWPDEVFTYDGRLLQAMSVAVTPGAPVRIVARDIQAPQGSAPVRLSLAADLLLTMVVE